MGVVGGPKIKTKGGLRLYYDLNNKKSHKSGSYVVNDMSGNGYDLVLQNNPLYTSSFDELTIAEFWPLYYLTASNSTSFPYISSNAGNSSGYQNNLGYLYGETDPCSGPVTFEQALKHAHDLGARLPTRDEVKAGAVAGTGCSYDYELVWTIDKANANGTQRWVTAGDPGRSGSVDFAGEDESRSVSSTAYVRYVNDSNATGSVTLSNDSIVYDYLTTNYLDNTNSAPIQTKFDTFYFDGVDDYGYVKELNYGGGTTISELTAIFWIRTLYDTNNISNDGALDTDNWAFLDFDRSEVFNIFLDGGGQLKFGGDSTNTGGFSSQYDLGAGDTLLFNDGRWHHAAVTFSVLNQEIKFYGDGKLLKTHTANGSMTALGAGSQRYGIVGDGSEASSENGPRNSFYYIGNIDYIMFYDNVALSEKDIAKNYKQTNTKKRYRSYVKQNK
jgi:hypothetical protein